MARYVDAEVAETLLNEAQFTEDDDHFLGLCVAENIIHCLPEADVAPVVHAKWVFGTTMNRGWMKCTNCCVSQTPCGTFSYCPNCGAKMRDTAVLDSSSREDSATAHYFETGGFHEFEPGKVSYNEFEANP